MKFLIIFVFSTSLMGSLCWGESVFEWVPKAESIFPIFTGVGVGAHWSDKFALGFSYGLTPELYYNTIADVSAELGGNSYYKDVVNAAFEDNQIFQINFGYGFSSLKAGWQLSGSVFVLNSKGEADIDKVLGATTGEDYSSLKNLLLAAGRDSKVDMDSQLMILGVSLNYLYSPREPWILEFGLGIAKVVSSEVQLQSGLPNFESSQIGQNLMRQSESDLEEVITQNALSPTLHFGVGYCL